MGIVELIGLVAALAQLADYANRARHLVGSDDRALAAFQAVVDAAATGSVHALAGDRDPAEQEELFEQLRDLVAAGDATAWAILGNPHLAEDDVAHLGARVAALASEFSRRLHAGLANEASCAGSDLTNMVVVSTLTDVSEGVADIRQNMATLTAGVQAVVANQPANVERLPMVVRAALDWAAEVDSEGALRLSRTLTGGSTAAGTMTSLTSGAAPGWWTQVSGRTVFAAATFAGAYGEHAAASALYERAAGLDGVNPARCFAHAAHHSADDNIERAHALVEQGRRHDPADVLVLVVEALLRRDPAAVVTAAGTTVHAADMDVLVIAGIQQWALGVSDRLSDAIEFARECVALRPEFSGMNLQLARMLRERAESRRATRGADLTEALSAALVARDVRRTWLGPSADAAHEACMIAAALEDWESVIRLGTVPPDGEATPLEAADDQVIGQVAAAAVLSGRRDLTTELLGKVSGTFHRHLLAGWVAAGDGDEDTAIAELTAAIEAASDDNELSWALRGLAGLQVWPLPRLNDLAERHPETATVITGISEIQRGLFDEAVARLNPFRRTIGGVPLMLAQAHESSGRPDVAVDELRAAYEHSGDASLLLLACRILMRAERFDEAEALAGDAISSTPAGSPVRHRFRRRLIELAARRGTPAASKISPPPPTLRATRTPPSGGISPTPFTFVTTTTPPGTSCRPPRRWSRRRRPRPTCGFTSTHGPRRDGRRSDKCSTSSHASRTPNTSREPPSRSSSPDEAIVRSTMSPAQRSPR